MARYRKSCRGLRSAAALLLRTLHRLKGNIVDALQVFRRRYVHEPLELSRKYVDARIPQVFGDLGYVHRTDPEQPPRFIDTQSLVILDHTHTCPESKEILEACR